MDCGGTARCGVYPKKRINTVNLVPVGAVGPLAQYITEDIYVSDVKEDTIAFTDEEVKVEKAVEETKEPGAPKTKAQARKELAEANQGKKPGIITRIGIGVGQVVNKFFAAGRESIEMVIKNVLPFMAFTSTILGIIQVSGLGNIIANTISPLCSTMPGMIVISLRSAIPVTDFRTGSGYRSGGRNLAWCGNRFGKYTCAVCIAGIICYQCTGWRRFCTGRLVPW